MKQFTLTFLCSALLLVTACHTPLASSGAYPGTTGNSVSVTINSNSRSGLISVGTASLNADVYDILIYNASNTYRTVVTTVGSPVTLSNLVPGTYAVLVLAGKSNGAAKINGTSAALLLGSGDVPYTPGKTLTGGPITTVGVSPTDGRGITVGSSGNTAVSVTLQNVIYTTMFSGAGVLSFNPNVATVGSSVQVGLSIDFFLNQTSAANAVAGPLTMASLTSGTNVFKVAGTPLSFTSTSLGGLAAGVAVSHLITLNGNFQVPASSGSSTVSVDLGSLVNVANGANVGRYLFANTVAGTSAVPFSSVSTNSGTPVDWYLPSDALTVAMPALKDSNNVAVPGAVSFSFSTPGADVTVGWGAGR